MPVLPFGEGIWRRKGLSILGTRYNFLISYVRSSNFFLLKQILDVLKFTLTLCSHAAILLLQLTTILLSFFCVSLYQHEHSRNVHCRSEAAIWTKSNLNEFIFKKITYLINSFIQFTVLMNIGDCPVKSNQWGSATVIFSISLNDYPKLLQLHTQGRIQVNN